MASYSRNFKRVAGPGFHVNVRFDDANNRLCKTGGNKVEIANRGFAKVHSNELFDVKEGEILLAKKQSHTRDGFARCFSSLNGYQLQRAGGGATLADLSRDVYENNVFIGIAATDFKSDNKGYMDQGFVSQVGGVVTLRHEGPQTLHPGDLVAWSIPTSHYKKVRKGIPPFKERLVLIRASQRILDANSGRERIIGKAMSYARSGDTVDILLTQRSNY